MLELVLRFWNVITHLNLHLAEWARDMGGWLYVALFIVVFCETGLVVTPFLPGDSLLFAVGALCALDGSTLSVGIMVPLLMVAAVLGDAVNYSVGRHVGPRIFTSETSWLLNKKHLVKTQGFYERYGGKTIIIARFIPIIRTFAPFVAGIGQMRYPRFFAFNVIGAMLWVGLFLPAGYMFGNLPFVEKQFHYVILGIIVVSVMPAAVEVLREWRARRVQPSAESTSG
ncbi:MAG TPA: DedA family protein [Polyangiaceae bacterium]|nr:DedA family protein [Polyangiaceae bacterium]